MRKLLFLAVLAISLLPIYSGDAGAQFDQVIPEVCNEKQNTSQSVACNEITKGANETNPVTSTIQRAVSILSVVIGVAAIMVIIVAGVTMTMSQGDAGKVKSSRDAIIYAAVGLVVAGLARAIVTLIVNRTR